MPMTASTRSQVHRVVETPALHVVLHQPEIPANTGNIARLCGAAETRLHLIHPLGFSSDDRSLKRAGLDYWHEVDVRHHDGFGVFLEEMARSGRGRLIAFSSHGPEIYTRAEVEQGDFLLFGKESVGLPEEIRRVYPCYRIPIWGKVRSLNLSTAVGIIVYHCLHSMGRF